MTRKLILFTVCLILLCAGLALAQQPASLPAKPQPQPSAVPGNLFQGHFTVGTLGSDNADYIGRLTEYSPARQGARGVSTLAFWGSAAKVHYDFRGAYGGDNRDQSYSMYLDVNRIWRTEVRFTRLLHRLDHDPLDSLDAAKGAVVVQHSDLDPNRLYAIARGELQLDSTLVIPKLRGVEFRFGYRDERRDGHKQATTMSKCATCHNVSMTRSTDQLTQDFTAGASVKVSRFSLEYGYLHRRFRERAASAVNTYDLVQQPATTAKIFDNRIQYGVANGPLPFDVIPRSRKESHTIRARVDLPHDIGINLNFVKSNVDNEDFALNVDTMLWSARIGAPLGKRAFVTARFRQMQIEGNDMFVNVVEPAAIAGPQLGKTFVQSYPTFGAADWTRFSAESRRPTTAEFELSYRLAKRSTLRAGYTWEQVRRDHGADFLTPYQTRRNTTFLSFNMRTADRTWQLRTRYSFEAINNPFRHITAAYMPVIQPAPSPGVPPSPLLGTQYYTLYDSRMADLTNQPNRVHAWEHSLTWTPTGKFSASTHLRWRHQSNDQLTMSTWKNTSLSPGVELWFAPHPRFSVMAGYHFHRDRGETWFTLPVWDG